MDQTALLRIGASLTLIVLLILACGWLARRTGWLRGQVRRSSLQVLGMHSLGGRAQVALVQVEGARLVLGVTAQQVSLLHTLPPQSASDLAAHHTPGAGLPGEPLEDGFAATLNRLRNRLP